jgi:glutathione S-transferase
MKLFYSPGACSLSPHIVLRELALPFELDALDFATRKTAGGHEYAAINPKGYVPALQLDDGQILTEGPAIVQYLADQRPESGLMPPVGSLERYRVIEWLTYIGTELHKGFGPFFAPNSTDEAKNIARERLYVRIDFVDKALEGRPFLLGSQFTVADAYLFVVLGWSKFVDIDLSKWPNVSAYQARVAARPAVQAAMKAEGLLR